MYFSKAFFEGLIFGGACVRREICFLKSIYIGIACSGNKIYIFLLCFTLYWRENSKYKLPGGLIFGGAIYGRVFLRYGFERLIFGGAYTWRGLFLEFYGIRWVFNWSAVLVEAVFESSFGFTLDILFGAVVALNHHVDDVFEVTDNVLSDRFGFACRVECV